MISVASTPGDLVNSMAKLHRALHVKNRKHSLAKNLVVGRRASSTKSQVEIFKFLDRSQGANADGGVLFERQRDSLDKQRSSELGINLEIVKNL